MEGLVLVLAPVIALLLWGAISPRSQWRKLVAWAYRDPEANEPSEAMYTLTRVGSVVLLIVLVCQFIGLANAGDDTGARPTEIPATFTTEEQRAQLRSAFGVDEATVVTPPVVTSPPGSAQPVKILRQRKIDATKPPAYVGQALAGQTGTWLVLGVRADAPPTAVDIREMLSRLVAVSVLTGCEANCATAPVESGAAFYLVTVRLDDRLADRLVVDATGTPIP